MIYGKIAILGQPSSSKFYMALTYFQLNDYILQSEQPEGLLPPYLGGNSYSQAT